MSTPSPKHQLYGHFAALARTLGNEHRLELLELLAQRPQPVEVLTARTGMTFGNVSQHLQHLKKAGLVLGVREGKNVVYRLQDGPIVEALAALRKLAEHNMAEVQSVISGYFHRLDSMEAISAEDLMSRLSTGSAILLDVRPEDEYRAGHLPQARNITLSDLERRLEELPQDQEIIAYCRGPYCVLSFEAVATLRAKGYKVRRLEEGFPEWKAAGLVVETAA
jgi:rhodanese-related sulfurtransferase/DNA-binding transcriptional ArsR family regulator